MTVKQSRDEGNAGSDLLNPKEFRAMGDSAESERAMAAAKKFSDDRILYGRLKVRREVEAESETEEVQSEAEEVERRRSAAAAAAGRWRRRSTKKKIDEYVHNQILKIREEDSHIGQEIWEGLGAKEKVCGGGGLDRVVVAASHVDLMMFSRPILPASPLGARTTPFKTVH